MDEKEIQKLLDSDDFKEHIARFFRDTKPTCSITGGGPTDLHGRSEYCVSTNTGQGLHYYEGGQGKMKSNKSFETIGVYAMPTSYVFDENGKIVETFVGVIEWDSEEIINKLKML